MKKSALTSALTGAPGSEPTGVPPLTPPAKSAQLDHAAFPCLSFADEVDAGGGETGDAQAGFDLTSVEIIGSAPTNVVFKGAALADYELTPWGRRKGKEVVPSELMADKAATGSLKTGNFLSETVIGSLPKGLDAQTKAKIAQSVPMSPSTAALKEVNMEAVTSRSSLGKALRRQVIKGAVMVFVTAGYSGKRFIFEKAKELGVKSIVLDGPDSWCQLLEKDGIISKFIPIDFSDPDTVFDRCLEAIRSASKTIGDLDGITTFCEMAVPLASRLAEQLGLPHNSVEAVDNARDKHATREIMQAAGLPTPKHFKITKPEDVEVAGNHVGFPAVIKPISGAASIGVIRVNDMEHLQSAYRRVVNDMKKARIVAGALIEGGDDDAQDGNAGSWINTVLMLEEYLDGDEIDCDLIFDNGIPVYGAITDNWPTVEPYFNETGSNCPSILSKAKQIELVLLSIRSVQALGFKLGVFHVECKYTSRGPRLIEVNCRMGGGPVRDTNLLVWGVDLVEEHLMACAGIPVRPPVAPRPLKQMAEYTVNAQVTGVLQHVDFLDKWKAHPDVLYARELVKPGHKCVCVKDGLPTWICELMVTKPTVREAIAFAKDIADNLDVPIVPTKA